MDDQLTPGLLLKASEAIANQGQCVKLAVELGFSMLEVQVVNSAEFRQGQTARDLLFRWCSKKGEHATVQALCTALTKIERADLAAALQGEPASSS